jgi:HlyD family secretion protein
MNEKINIKSDEITEILGTPPRWIIRWGITIVFTVIAVVLVGSIFFRYPDTVMAPVVITAENPPSVVIARANGKPAALFVKDGQLVNRGDTLGVIENPASYRDIFFLSALVSSNLSPDSTLTQIQSSRLALGDLQQSFNSYSRALTEHQIFAKQMHHKQKIEALENEFKHYKIYYKQLVSQQNLTIKDLELTLRQFARDSMLHTNKVIATAEFERSQSALLAKHQALENSKLSLSNTAITIERLKQSIADVKIDYQSQRIRLDEEVLNSHRQLASALAAWQKNYLLVATSTGKLTFMNIWSSLQEVKAGDPLFAITPASIGQIQARMIISFQGAGKVKLGQRVNIKLDGFSYLEFGMIEGEIQSISSGYNEKGFPALASLPNGVVTNYGFTIQLDRELMGMAEITTEDLSLIQRLFSPLKHLLKSKLKQQ